MLSLSNPIGVFDSGFGGLTVYKALRDALPHEDFVYLGDMARLPYGTKSAETVEQYALQAARFLTRENIKLLVVACNTASALGLPMLRKQLPLLPCFGVIEPGAEAAAATSVGGRIAVLSTEATARARSYVAAIRRYRPDADVQGLGCSLLVSLVEEGWWEGPEAEAVTRRYLQQLGVPGKNYDTLMLGCTHFPPLTPLIHQLIGPNVPIVDSAVTTAAAVRHHLETTRQGNAQTTPGKSRFIVTDSPERFSQLAARFVVGEEFAPGKNVFHASLSGPDAPKTEDQGLKRGTGSGF